MKNLALGLTSKIWALEDKFFIFGLSIAFYLALFFNLDNKTLALFFWGLIGILFLRLKNLRETLFWGFILSLPVIVGKTYLVQMISASQLYQPNNPEGYFLKLVITPGNVLALFMLPLLVMSLFKLWKEKRLHFDSSLFFLILLLLLVFVSSLNSQNPPVSLFFFLKFLQLPLIFIYSRFLIRWNEREKTTLLLILFSQVVFEGFFVFLQLAHGGPLGHSLESMTKIVPFGAGADEDVWRFRPTGTFDHANYVAAFLAPILILNFSLFYTRHIKNFNYFLPSFLIAAAAIALSLSRSAWISIMAAIIVLTFLLEKRFHLRIQMYYQKRFIIITFLGIIITPFFIGPRIFDSFNTFVNGGSFFTRIELIKEVLEIITQHPFLGTGFNMSVLEMFKNNPLGMMYFFPSPVHDWYLYFASEAGIPALLAFLFLLNFSFKRAFQKKTAEIFSVGMAVAILAILVNGIFQPFLGNETLLFVFLGILTSEAKNG